MITVETVALRLILLSLRFLWLGLVLVGMMITLTTAHASSLHVPHADHGTGTPEHECSPATCSALALDEVVLLAAPAALVRLMPELRLSPPLALGFALDPPPRA